MRLQKTKQNQTVPISAISMVNKYDGLVMKYLKTRKYICDTMNYVAQSLDGCDKFMKKRGKVDQESDYYIYPELGKAECVYKIRRRYINQLQATGESIIYNSIRDDMLQIIEMVINYTMTNIMTKNKIQNTRANRDHFGLIIARRIHYIIDTNDRTVRIIVVNNANTL